jgi:hypothetical protein
LNWRWLPWLQLLLLLLLLLLVCEYVHEMVKVKQVPVHPLQQVGSAAQTQHSMPYDTTAEQQE